MNLNTSYSAYPYDSKCPSGDKPYNQGPDASIPGGLIADGYWNEAGDKTNHYESLDFWVDKPGFAQCNCTSYAASRLNEVAPIGFNNNYKEKSWGNAGKWDTAADQALIPRSDQPFPGDVAYWDTGSTPATSYGHVAFVEKVEYDQNGKVTKTYISEYNGKKIYDYTYRSFTPSDTGWLDKPTGYIHFLSHEYSKIICAPHSNGKELCWSIGDGDISCQSGIAHFYNDKAAGVCLSAESNDCAGISGATNTVVGGRGGGVPSIISGPGAQLPATEVPSPGLPDFTETSLKLMDKHGNERYTYYLFDDEIEMHHWSTNIGEADWAGTADDINVRFYLSKGYKARNSDGDWVRIGTENIKKGNLNVGAIKHEWTTLSLNDYFSNGYLQDDHVYNIVVCVDRLHDTDNGDGEVPEMHESNNCTSEAVFIFKESTIPPAERRALVALYDSTNGPGWMYKDGWKTDTDPCTWCMVDCRDGHVTQLNLGMNRLSGSIPPEIDDFENLNYLILGCDGHMADFFVGGPNQLSSIPAEIGNLVSLTHLDLENNRLSSIPVEIGNLANLTHLNLKSNQLNSIPAEIGNLANLTHLNLNYNQLNSIPAEIGNLVSLTQLDLESNRFNSIPAEIGNLFSLTYLNLENNQRSVFIPPELGNLTNLSFLTLYNSHMSGPIPAEIGNLTNLTALYMGKNQLSGSIPPEIGNLVNLTYLDLGSNQLNGSIPPEIGNLVNLRGLGLSSNQLNGSIPPEIGALVNLLGLDLSSNQLNGSIPPEIGNLVNLRGLDLSSNQLNGSIPPEINNLINISNIKDIDIKLECLNLLNDSRVTNFTVCDGALYLSNNQLGGIVPLPVATSASKITGCYFYNNDPSLCIPDTSDYRAIGQNLICGLPLSTACAPSDDQTIDFDKDGYTDLQEYLNAVAGVTDPQGKAFNTLVQNAPGGVGYYLPYSNKSHSFWQMMLPAIIHGKQPQK